MRNDEYPFTVGDVVVPADGSQYRGEVIAVDEEFVRHRCLATGRVYEKTRLGFYSRYVHERLEQKQDDEEVLFV